MTKKSMSKLVKLTACTVLVGFMPGCMAMKAKVPEQQPHAELKETRDSITRAAELIHNDLQSLRKMQEKPGTPLPVPSPVATGALARPVTLQWAGPALPAVATVAEMIGYKLDAKGFVTKSQPIIYITAKDKTALSVLEDIGWQAGADMGVVVSEKDRTIYVFSGGGK